MNKNQWLLLWGGGITWEAMRITCFVTKWKSGEGVGTQVHLVVKTILLRLVHFNVYKIYLKMVK